MNALLCHWFGSFFRKILYYAIFSTIVCQRRVCHLAIYLLATFALHCICNFCVYIKTKKRLFKIHSAKFNFNGLTSTNATLFRKKRIMFDEKFQRNASKFAIIYIYTLQTQSCFFRFSFFATLFFPS